jgi:hypothetical protein
VSIDKLAAFNAVRRIDLYEWCVLKFHARQDSAQTRDRIAAVCDAIAL